MLNEKRAKNDPMGKVEDHSHAPQPIGMNNGPFIGDSTAMDEIGIEETDTVRDNEARDDARNFDAHPQLEPEVDGDIDGHA